MLSRSDVDRIVALAMSEDSPWGDITTSSTVGPHHRSTARFVARHGGVMAGTAFVDRVFSSLDIDHLVTDGEAFSDDEILLNVTGSTALLLEGERAALNLLQRACAVATTTRQYVDAVRHTTARIVDTRKTTPGLRALEKHAVVSGGGHNHRYSLSDAVMVKDNHLAVWREEDIDIPSGLSRLKHTVGHTVHIEVEVDDLMTLSTVVDTGLVDTVLLDNFSLDDLRAGVTLVDGRCLVEASGGVNLHTVAAIAGTGVDLISVGALTNGVPAIDIGLDFA